VIPKAGHHIYSDNPEEFHKAVFHACKTLKSKRKFNELG
jgi:pimeloyl-ACP methyl ester carboxylesterase